MNFKNTMNSIMGGAKLGNTVLSIDKFMPTLSENIKIEYDFNYYKSIFGDKLDDEFIAIFEMLEDANISKKQLNILSYMLQKLYKEKYSDVERCFIKEKDLKKLEPFNINDYIYNKNEQHTENIGEDVKYIQYTENIIERKEPIADYDLFIQAIKEIENEEFQEEEDE